VGQLYFWSFELVVFMVLLNFLLAIIVDAFCEVKESTSSSASIVSDLLEMMRIRCADARAMAGPFLAGRSRTRLSSKEMGLLLKELAFTTDRGEGSQFEARTALVGADKRVLQLGTVKLSRHDVAEVLRAQNSKAAAAQDASEQSGWSWLPWGGSNRVDLTSEQELQKMAYWVFERFSEEDKGQEGAYKFMDLDGAAFDAGQQEAGDVRLQFARTSALPRVL
jgi:hypothetical protein